MGPHQINVGILVWACLVSLAVAGCPFKHSAVPIDTNVHSAALGTHDPKAVTAVNWKAVKNDLRDLILSTDPVWPSDFNGNYGGLFIRQAWHCAGSYRTWDGRGGCEGGRQRFDPERSWPDNTNLDKSKVLLAPIKQKYGKGLSWGDLIILAGDVSIEVMGGPQALGFCAGRIDDPDGTASLELGPTKEQEEVAPCTAGDGMCEQPLGQTTMGLIYVNPEGVMGVPDPPKSVPHIRGTFGRMNMNDSETVALIGGGHAIGKTHGACPTGAGPGPDKQPDDPWPGTCGHGREKGKGKNTFTSGFEGSWVTQPTRWTNQFFRNLLKYDWEVHEGPGGHQQWRPKHKPTAPAAVKAEPLPKIMMLTTDVALLHDPAYLQWVKVYAENEEALRHAFKHAWYKLVTRDMGPASRCLGNLVPPPQPFQHPLPPPAAKQPNFRKVVADIKALLHSKSPAAESDTTPEGQPTWVALFATLAWQCASTFRQTDYAGGCNGAYIRLEPQKGWPTNKGLDQVLSVLEPIKDKYPTLSYADLIVLAGTVSVAHTARQGPQAVGAAAWDGLGRRDLFSFCPKRSDAAVVGPEPLDYLAPRSYKSAHIAFRDNAKVAGLTPHEAVVLSARPRSPSQQRRLGFSGSWDPQPSQLSNKYFKLLLEQDWKESKAPSGEVEYSATVDGQEVYMTPADLAIKQHGPWKAIAEGYAADDALFVRAFAAAWTKVMNADRFKGPAGSLCSEAGASLGLDAPGLFDGEKHPALAVA